MLCVWRMLWSGLRLSLAQSAAHCETDTQENESLTITPPVGSCVWDNPCLSLKVSLAPECSGVGEAWLEARLSALWLDASPQHGAVTSGFSVSGSYIPHPTLLHFQLQHPVETLRRTQMHLLFSISSAKIHNLMSCRSYFAAVKYTLVLLKSNCDFRYSKFSCQRVEARSKILKPTSKNEFTFR